MGLFIKGKQIPKSCAECDEDMLRMVVDCTLFESETARHKGCPLIEVPTPHGRLFEEQKLLRPIVETLTVDEINKVTSIFMNVPATIEAEG